MSDSAADESNGDDFVKRSQAFVEWFRNAEGTRLSDKIQLADLRHRGAGRGVGTFRAASVLLRLT